MKEFASYYALLVVPLEDKKGITITKAFQNFLSDSNCKPIKIWLDKGSIIQQIYYQKILFCFSGIFYFRL